MELSFKKADAVNLDELVTTRIEVLRAANQLENAVDMSAVEKESRAYYKKALAEGSHTAYLVYDGDIFVGAGGVSYYAVMPTYHNSTGKRAYIMNMYTRPDYRRKGIAFLTLDLLVEDAKRKGAEQITLEATAMGKSLYQKYGFVECAAEMELVHRLPINRT